MNRFSTLPSGPQPSWWLCLLLALWLCCTLAACRTQRNSATTRKSERLEASAIDARWLKAIDARTLSDARVDMRLLVYDTSQPADSATGRPPLAAELVATAVRRDSSTAIATEDGTSAAKNYSEHSSEAADIDRCDSRTSTSRLAWFGSGVLAVLLLSLWLNVRSKF